MTHGRICFLTETYYPMVGGTQTQVRIVAADMAAAGHEVLVITRRSDRSLAAYELVDGIPVHRVSPVGPGRGKRWWMLFSCFAKLVALRACYDVIFVAAFRTLGIAAVIAARMLGKKCILRAANSGEMSGEFFADGLARHGLTVSSPPVRVMLRARNALLRKADRFVAVSSEIERELLANGVPRGSILAIPNYVDTDQFVPADPALRARLRKALSLPADAPIVTYTGRLVSYKGLPVLVQAWAGVHRTHPSAVLVLVGTEGNDKHNCEKQLRDYVRDNRIEQWVKFTGEVHNVYDYLQASDVFVLPTGRGAREGLSNSLLEAMSCGIPVVSTPLDAMKDIVVDGENSILVEPGDPMSLQAALEDVMGDPARAEALGRSARRTVLEKFSRKAVMQAYLDVLK